MKIKDELVLVSSTGVIGKRLPLKKIESGIGNLVKGLNETGIEDAAAARNIKNVAVLKLKRS